MSADRPALGADETPEQGPRILLYSDDVDTRAQVRVGVGRRLGRGTPDIAWTEAATAPVALQHAETGTFDLLILDGESAKVGGMALARQVKDEIFDCPPVLVLTGRPQDAWLAAWSDADAVVSQPLDPIELHAAVAGLLSKTPAA
jgi:DNA-binding response OmpR family regulator